MSTIMEHLTVGLAKMAKKYAAEWRVFEAERAEWKAECASLQASLDAAHKQVHELQRQCADLRRFDQENREKNATAIARIESLKKLLDGAMTSAKRHYAALRSERRRNAKEKISTSESVWGFVGWLATRDEAITISAKHDAAPAVELVKEWCDAFDLPAPRENAFEGNIDRRLLPRPANLKAMATAEGVQS